MTHYATHVVSYCSKPKTGPDALPKRISIPASID